MKTRVTLAAVAIVSLAVGYAIGQSQRTGVAASAMAIDPHAGHVMADEHAGHAMEALAGGAMQTVPVPSNLKIPATDSAAKDRLNASPRHGEYARTRVGGVPLNLWVVYPERRDKAPVVVVIHGAGGFNDWVRGVGDQLAAEGFIAVVPDLLSGMGPHGGGSESFVNRDDVGKMLGSFSRSEINARINAARDYGLQLPAANGKSATMGFCSGGTNNFAYTVSRPELNAAVVFYGSAPAAPDAAPGSFVAAETLANIKAPILGLYGGDDARINATIPSTQEKMKALGKIYETHIFEGAGHGFLGQQGGQNGANLRASEQAWPIAIAFLKKHTGASGS
jgi:carboxymethylenebutenolidase